MYDPKNIQATSPPHSDRSCGNRIIVHSLYRSGQLPRHVRLRSAVGSIHILWRPVAHYTVGIRSRKPTSHFTTPWVHSRGNRIIVHPLYGSAQLPDSGPLTSLIGSVHIKGICVALMQHVYNPENEQATSPPHAWESLMFKPHYRAPAVRITIATWMRSPYINHVLCTHLRETSSTL